MSLQEDTVAAFKAVQKEYNGVNSLVGTLLMSTDFANKDIQIPVFRAINTVLADFIAEGDIENSKTILERVAGHQSITKEKYIALTAPLFGQCIIMAKKVDAAFTDTDEEAIFEHNKNLNRISFMQYDNTSETSSEHMAAREYIKQRLTHFIQTENHRNAIRLAESLATRESSKTDVDKEALNYLLEQSKKLAEENSLIEAEKILSFLAINCAKGSNDKQRAVAGISKLCDLYIKAENPGKAKRMMDIEAAYSPRISDREPKKINPDVAIKIAGLLKKSGDTGKAIELLQTVIKENPIQSPGHGKAWFDLSNIRDRFIKQKHYPEALLLVQWQVESIRNETKSSNLACTLCDVAIGKADEIARAYYFEQGNVTAALETSEWAYNQSRYYNTTVKNETEVLICDIIDDCIDKKKDTAGASLAFNKLSTNVNHKIGTRGLKIAELYEENNDFKNAADYTAHGYIRCGYGSTEQVKSGEYLHTLIDKLITAKDADTAEHAVVLALGYYQVKPKTSPFIDETNPRNTGLNRDILQAKVNDVALLHVETKGISKAVTYACDAIRDYNNSGYHYIRRDILEKVLHRAFDEVKVSEDTYKMKMIIEKRGKAQHYGSPDKDCVISRHHEIAEVLLNQRKYEESYTEASEAYGHYLDKDKNASWAVINTVRDYFESVGNTDKVKKIVEWQECFPRPEHRQEITDYLKAKKEAERKEKEFQGSAANILARMLGKTAVAPGAPQNNL